MHFTFISLTLLGATSSFISAFPTKDSASLPEIAIPFTTNAKRLAAGLPPLPPRQRAPKAKTGRAVVPLKTNAQRMAAGLPPLPPRLASRTDTAKRTHSSPSSPRLRRGHVRVRRADNLAHIGQISQNLRNGHYIVQNRKHAASFQFTAGSGITSQLQFKDISNNRRRTPFLGFTLASTSMAEADTMDLTGDTFAIAIGAGPNGRASFRSPTFNGGATGSVQTATWVFDQSTRFVTAEWTNSDGSVIPTTAYYNPARGGSLVLVTIYDSQYPEHHPGAYPVVLDFVRS